MKNRLDGDQARSYLGDRLAASKPGAPSTFVYGNALQSPIGEQHGQAVESPLTALARRAIRAHCPLIRQFQGQQNSGRRLIIWGRGGMTP